MKFANPQFLFALFAIAIPIIIHLFNFRKFKKVYFSNVRFLKEVKQETQSKSKLKHLLILISRILAITFLVFAFAQPYIPVENKKLEVTERSISVFLDNSFSMEAVSANGTLLEEAKKHAREITSAYKPTDKFQLLTNDFEGKHQRLLSKEEFLSMLDEVKISSSNKNITEVYSRQKDVLNNSNSKGKDAFILSDFQKSIADFERIKPDTGINVRLIPLQAQQINNLYIDSCWFETPFRQIGKVENLHVRIKNQSEKSVENVPIKLLINKQQKGLASFSVDANSAVDTVITFTSSASGLNSGEIQINDYPITYDDRFYFSFEVNANIKVLSINGESENNFLNTLFKGDNFFQFTNTSDKSVDYVSLPKNNLIILNELKNISSGLSEELSKFIMSGGSLIVFPNANPELDSYNNFLSRLNVSNFAGLDTANTRVDKINLNSEIYNDVFEKIPENIDLPKLNSHFIISKNSKSTEEVLLRIQNGNSFLSKFNVNRGKVYLCSVPLNIDFSNFPKHAVFVPTLYKIALYSQPESRLYYTLGKDEVITVKPLNVTGETILHIVNPEKNFDVIPEHRLVDLKPSIFVHSQINDASNYLLLLNKDTVQSLSFNYNRTESDLTSLNISEIQTQITENNLSNFNLLDARNQEITQVLRESAEGKKLWKWCVILALIFLACEVLLIRFGERFTFKKQVA